MKNRVSDIEHRLSKALTMREKRAADLSNDLQIPKSAISQYLSGKSKKMDSDRLFAICKYLDVNESWLLGYDVPVNNADIETEKPTEFDGLSDSKKRLIEFAKTVPEDKVDMILRVMKSIVEGGQ